MAVTGTIARLADGVVVAFKMIDRGDVGILKPSFVSIFEVEGRKLSSAYDPAGTPEVTGRLEADKDALALAGYDFDRITIA